MRVRLVSLLLCGILTLTALTGHMVAQTSAATPAAPSLVVASYFSIFDRILQGASTSELAQVYAPTATFSYSNPMGKTVVEHGLPAITKWFKAFAATHTGYHFTLVSENSPVPGMVVRYEIASNAANIVKGRCAHIFAVVNGQIISDNFVGYATS